MLGAPVCYVRNDGWRRRIVAQSTMGEVVKHGVLRGAFRLRWCGIGKLKPSSYFIDALSNLSSPLLLPKSS